MPEPLRKKVCNLSLGWQGWLRLGVLLLVGFAMPVALSARTTRPQAPASATQAHKAKRPHATPSSDIATAVRAAAEKDCGCGECAAKGCAPCKGKNCYYCAAKSLATKECGCGTCDAKGCESCGAGCDVCKFNLAPVAEAKSAKRKVKTKAK